MIEGCCYPVKSKSSPRVGKIQPAARSLTHLGGTAKRGNLQERISDRVDLSNQYDQEECFRVASPFTRLPDPPAPAHWAGQFVDKLELSRNRHLTRRLANRLASFRQELLAVLARAQRL